jgi:pyrroline-5-carboxylate reductase
MLKDTLGILGCGNMGEAIVRGLLAKREAASDKILVSVPHAERLDALTKAHGVAGTLDNRELVRRSSVVILAVKPQILDRVLAEIAPELGQTKLFISVAAGVSLARLERALPPPARVIRTMPNVAALVGAAATGLAAGTHASPQDLQLAETLFGAVGLTAVVEEELLDAVTGLSGSGPAYIFLIIEALSDAGVKVGLSRAIAQKLAAQTVLGSAKLLLETGRHPGALKDMVTSPGGTAIAGLHTLEAGGLRTTLIDAVEAATERAHRLGKRETGG